MKLWKEITIVFAPLLLVLWLVLGLITNFKDATIAVLIGLFISAVATAWVIFAHHILKDE